MTEQKIFELTVSLLSFLKTHEKKKLVRKFSCSEEIFNLNIKDLSLLVERSIKVKDFSFEDLKIKHFREILLLRLYPYFSQCPLPYA